MDFLKDSKGGNKFAKKFISNFISLKKDRHLPPSTLAKLKGTLVGQYSIPHELREREHVDMKDGCVCGEKAGEVKIPTSLISVAKNFIYQPGILPQFYEWRDNVRNTFADGTKNSLLRQDFQSQTHKKIAFTAMQELPHRDARQEKYWLFPSNSISLGVFRDIFMKAGLAKVLGQFATNLKTGPLCLLNLGFALIGNPIEAPVVYTNMPSLEDCPEFQRKAYHIFIPLKLLDGSAPELAIYPEGSVDKSVYVYKYKKDAAIAISGDLSHATRLQDGEWIYPDDLRIILVAVVCPNNLLQEYGSHPFEAILTVAEMSSVKSLLSYPLAC